MLQGYGITFTIQARTEPVQGVRPVIVMLDILFPRPDEFYRPGNRPGYLHGFSDEVLLNPAAKAATEECRMYRNLFRRNAGTGKFLLCLVQQPFRR